MHRIVCKSRKLDPISPPPKEVHHPPLSGDVFLHELWALDNAPLIRVPQRAKHCRNVVLLRIRDVCSIEVHLIKEDFINESFLRCIEFMFSTQYG